METKYYVHHTETFAKLGEFNSQQEAYSFIELEGYKADKHFEMCDEDDFCVDRVLVNEEEGVGYLQYFHITPTANIDSIAKEGLVPALGPRSKELSELQAAVFLFPTISDAENALDNWLGDSFIEECTCVEFCEGGHDIPLSILEIWLPYEDFKKHICTTVAYERCVFKTIPFAHIHHITDLID